MLMMRITKRENEEDYQEKKRKKDDDGEMKVEKHDAQNFEGKTKGIRMIRKLRRRISRRRMGRRRSVMMR